MAQALKIVFAGTPEISKLVLDRVLVEGFSVGLVLTQMDRPAGRGKKLSMSLVKQLALEKNIEVFQPLSFRNNPAAIEKVREFKPDLMIVVAYGLILPRELLDIPRLGCVNIHVSLLPHLRGAAPIQRAILNGDEYSGVTIMQIDEGLDTGDILLQQKVKIDECETSGTLYTKLTNLGGEMIIDYLRNYDKVKRVVQDDTKATYANKINKLEAQINWNEEAGILERKIRGFNPIPGCFTFLGGERLLIWEACVSEQSSNLTPGQFIKNEQDEILVACGNNSVLKINELQLAGRKRQIARQFVLGYNNLFEEILGG